MSWTTMNSGFRVWPYSDGLNRLEEAGIRVNGVVESRLLGIRPIERRFPFLTILGQGELGA